MITEKLLIFLVLFSSIPFAYSRNAKLRDRKLFSRDVVIGRYHPHRSQQGRIFENQETTYNHKRELEIVDVNENIETSHNDQNKIQNQQNQLIQIVDVNKKAADFDEDKYEVQHRENREIGVNLEKGISDSQNLFSRDIITGRRIAHQNGRDSKNRVHSQNQISEFEVADINESRVDSPNGEHEVHNQRNQRMQVVDIEGNVADSDTYKYEVQHRENREIGVNIVKGISDSQNLFSRDIITGRRIAHQNGRGSKNRVHSQNEISEFEVADINESRVDSPNGQHEVHNQQNQQMQVVDIDGNVADSNTDKYEVQHRENREIGVNLEKGISDSQNLFSRDIITGRRIAHQNGRGSKNRVHSQNQISEFEVADINESKVVSPNGEHEVHNQQNQRMQVVDIDGNVADSDTDKYEVQHRENREIGVNLEKGISNSQSLFSRDIITGQRIAHQNGRDSKNRVHSQNQISEFEVADINESRVDSPNGEHEVHNQQNQQMQVVDIDGNVADSDTAKYEVQHRENWEIGVNLEIGISNSQNLFSRDIMTGRRIAHQNGGGSKNRVHSRNQISEFEVADINESKVDSPNGEHEVHDQQNQRMQVVDIDRNVPDSDTAKYEVQHQDNREITLDWQNNVPERQKPFYRDIVIGKQNSHLKHHVRRSGSYDNASDDPPKLVSVINGSVVNSANDKYEEQYQQNPEIQVVSITENVIDSEQNPQGREIVNGSGNDVNAPSYRVCQTVECKKLANDFINSLNKSVDPCENFYQFACSGWEVSKTLPPGQVAYSRMSMVNQLIQRDIKEILEIEPEPSDILPVKQAKKWYRSCIDTESLERRGLKPIESIMMQVGGWPMIMDEEEWDEKGYTWQSIERHYARLTGSYVFYDIAADYPAQGFTVGNISIDAPQLIWEQRRETWSVNSSCGIDDYRALALKVIDSFIQHNGATVSKERLSKEFEEMMAFEEALNKLKRLDKSEYYTSFEELIHWYNSNETDSKLGTPASRINWNELIQGLFESVNIKVLPSTNVHCKKPEYIKGIGELLKQTSLRTIVNYIHWNFIGNTLAFTTEEMRELFPKYTLERKLAIGEPEKEPRWLVCVEGMKMTHAAAYAYMKKKFTQETNAAALEIINNIREGLEQNINSSNWLDLESKALLKEKLDNMKPFIGFPEWYNNKTAIINYYKGITIGADYFDNSLSYMRYNRKQILKRYITPEPEFVPFGGEPATSTSVYAFYSTSQNFLGVSAAALMPPFFGPDFPNNINYAMVGSFAGHEMSHGFDDDDITFGKNGAKTELKNTTLESFAQRVDCFVDQFDEYLNSTNENPRIDGKKSVGENIADTTGLQATFRAYKIVSKQKNPDGEMRLPGLEDFTDDQLFFLSFAEAWCQVETPLHKLWREFFDTVHSRSDLRVMGAVSNMKDFAKAFNCPIGSPMNPSNKCSIWDKPDAKIN